jgi:hypothetical protein
MSGPVPSPFREQPKIVPPRPSAWPDVVPGGSFTPYVDHGIDPFGVRDPGVLGEKTPITWGTVQGIPWSVTAFMVDGTGDWKANGGPDGLPGPAGDLFLGPDGAFGGGGLSLYCTIPWQPRDMNLSSMVFGSGPLTVHAGV